MWLQIQDNTANTEDNACWDFFPIFFKGTLFLAKMVKINPPYILKEAIYFAEIIKSSSLARLKV